jgi:predicted nucleotide-binding protein
MTTPPVVDQDFVVHLFAPLDGPMAAQAYQQVRQLWVACREQLEMTEPITGIRAYELLPESADALPAADGLVAAQENLAGVRQTVLRRIRDVLNLSVALAQPAPEGLRPQPSGLLTRVQFASPPVRRRMGWADLAQLWADVSAAGTDAMLGEALVFLARMPPGETGVVGATAELGQSLDPLLPNRKDRPRDWWRWGSTAAEGYALWDTRPDANTSRVREIVVFAPSDRDREVSAWAWSDGYPTIPPFARHLMLAAKLRSQAHSLDAWKHMLATKSNVADSLAEIDAALSGSESQLGKTQLLRTRLSRLRAQETRLVTREGELARLRREVLSEWDDLSALGRRGAADDAPSLFAADRDLAQWLKRQIDNDHELLESYLNGIRRACTAATEELSQLHQSDWAPLTGPATSGTVSETAQQSAASNPADAPSQAGRHDVDRRVFVVHGRDEALRRSFFDLLRSLGLQPVGWEAMVAATGSATPYIQQVMAEGPHLAQAALILLSPDDLVQLNPRLLEGEDSFSERRPSGQPRPNVLIELGMALMGYQERTIVVMIGQMRPISDLSGLNFIRFDGSGVAIAKLINRLRQAGCQVDDSGTDWLDPGRFPDLPG